MPDTRLPFICGFCIGRHAAIETATTNSPQATNGWLLAHHGATAHADSHSYLVHQMKSLHRYRVDPCPKTAAAVAANMHINTVPLPQVTNLIFGG